MKKKEDRYCELCGQLLTSEDSPFSNRCNECRQYIKSPSGIPHYAKTNYNSREYAVRKEWTDRVTKKMDNIVADGYADRQKAESLRLAGKINTEL